ncbi:Uncharacterized protein Adt_07679 [Abeliophyllum distichum]|uniref:Uncharacterized protein n=1 Tax=Abeliophyllum distichum TaxID=126358 RepID=A0ABD1VAG0_9LAMI
MENYSSKSTLRHLPSNSCSSTDSIIFSSCSETDSSASKSTPKALVFHAQKQRKQAQKPAAVKPGKISRVEDYTKEGETTSFTRGCQTLAAESRKTLTVSWITRGRSLINQDDYDLDNRSCTSSDLFELENIGRVGIRDYQEELPVYGTTNLRLNRAIASGLVV